MSDQFRIHMRYTDAFGTHNVTEWIASETKDTAVAAALAGLESDRGVVARVVSAQFENEPLPTGRRR
jgi:hypothetical protein